MEQLPHTPVCVECRRAVRGFVLSVEMLLMAAVVGLGLFTAWTRLRDQSLSEVKDTISAVDAYIQGSTPLWETGGTRWIKDNTVLAPSAGNVSENWDGTGAWETVTLTGNTYTDISGRLVYAPAVAGPR